MEDFAKSIIEKISSYNLFTNLLPGVVFCYLVERTTRIVISTNSIWKTLFIYYFIGLLIGRISSLLTEPLLKKISVMNKEKKMREPYIHFAPYSDYIKASEESSFICTLNESSNMYRCFVTVFMLITFLKLFDWFIYDWIKSMGILGSNILIITICLLLSCIFILSYKKQVDYIRKRVEAINGRSIVKNGGKK